ncbi:MAG: NADH-quinone oxidoreductase subunit C [Candidatus Nezhaarchaeales archaeon]
MAEVHPDISTSLKEELKEALLDCEYIAKRRVLKVIIEKEALLRTIGLISKISNGEYHLTTITGADLDGDQVELTYFLWLLPQKLRVLIKTRVPKRELKIRSLTDFIPAAVLYERETYEMLGVVFEGHQKLERLFLPEDWPEGSYPLRRD